MKLTAAQLVRRPRDWLASLQDRERRALGLLAGFLLMVFLWLGIWKPVEAFRARSEASYHTARADLGWMRAHTAQARSQHMPARAVMPDNTPLLSVATEAAEAYGIAISHADPSADGSLRLSLASIPFDKLLPWVETLQRDHGVIAQRINIERQSSAPGQVGAAMTLQRQ